MSDTENETDDSKESVDEKPPVDPVRKWTLYVLGACLVLIAWHLVADRYTPYTSQARVHALVVPIASEVSGTVTDVYVSNNQFVKAGEELFSIDRERYMLTVQTAEADLQSARQATGSAAASVVSAEASVGSAIAGMIRSKKDFDRLSRIKEEDPGAISVRRLEQAQASLSVTEQQVAGARANLQKAIQDLGETGDENVRVLQAQAALEQALLNLERTTVRAPTDGLLTDVRVDRGNFASAGAPQMTFIAIHNIWVQADFTENNLGHIAPNDSVQISFDALPGQVFNGKVRSSGFGVAVGTTALGSLPTVDNNRQWLRDAQRFPIVVDIAGEKTNGIRVGSQASVIVYTGDSWILNSIGWLQIRIGSILSYAY